MQGFVVLPSALGPAHTRAALAATWDTIEAHVPRICRDDSATWTPITEAETAAAAALDRQLDSEAVGAEGYAPTGFGSLISIHNGADEEVLDLFPRALYGVAEQLLGEGSVVWPAGCDAEGVTRGPLLMDDNAVYVSPGPCPRPGPCTPPAPPAACSVCLLLPPLFLTSATAPHCCWVCAAAGVGGLPPGRFPRRRRAHTRRAFQRRHSRRPAGGRRSGGGLGDGPGGGEAQARGYLVDGAGHPGHDHPHARYGSLSRDRCAAPKPPQPTKSILLGPGSVCYCVFIQPHSKLLDGC
eukprot:SAG22_NODE_1084_length_5637_cov_2.170820_3_plen_296_part_00